MEFNEQLQRGLNLQTCQGHILNVQVENFSRKWMLKALVMERRVIPYRRSRTDLGAPIICTLESTQRALDEIIRYSDGFPLPSTTDDLNLFDAEVFVDNTRTVEVPIKQKQRSKSIPNLSVLRARIPSLQLKAPSKPKFLVNLFNNVGLSKKSNSGKLRNGLVIFNRSQENSTEEIPEEEFGNSKSQRTSEADDSDVFSEIECDLIQAEVETPINKTWSTPNSPKVVGIVQRRVKDFQELATGEKCGRSRSLSTPSSPHCKRRSIIRESDRLLLCTDDSEDSTVSVFCSGLLRNEHCRKMSGGAVKKYVQELDSRSGVKQKAEKQVSHVKELVGQFDHSSSEKRESKTNANINGQTALVQPVSPKVAQSNSAHGRQTAPVSPSVQNAKVKPPVFPKSPRLSPKSSPPFTPQSPPLCHSGGGNKGSVAKPTGYVRPQVHETCKLFNNNIICKINSQTSESNTPALKDEKNTGNENTAVCEENNVKPSTVASQEHKQGNKTNAPEDVQSDAGPAGVSSPKLSKKFESQNSEQCKNVTVITVPAVNSDTATEPACTENDNSAASASFGDSEVIYANSGIINAHNNDNTYAQENVDSVTEISEQQSSRSSAEQEDQSGINPNSEITRQISEIFDSSWSDSDFAELTDSDAEPCDEKKEEEKEKGVGECKLRKIANELLHTERAYVKKLILVDETFQAKIKEENEQHKLLPPEIIPQMFSNVGSIRQFHELHFLPNIEKRMEDWETQSKIGDLMKSNAPFLKMYAEYVKNFDHANSLITTWMEKSGKFAAVIQEIQKKPECCCLTLQHHMLEPIQRVPRYEMLLKDYIKHLPQDADDLADAKAALEKVTQAAEHSNEAMKKIEKFHKLLEIKEKVATTTDLISPTRELVREGRIKKISARGGERLDRYLFLFNDLLLICCEPLLGSYKIKAELDMDGLEIMDRTDKTVRWILEGENMDIPNTFYVKSTQKIIQFLDENSGETGWSESIKNVIKEFRLRKQSLMGIDNENGSETILESELGRVAPRWIKDDEVTMCMLCTKHFTGIRRRHHCRACGNVVCGKCSGKKVDLPYDNNKHSRVCDKCYGILKHHDTETDATPKSKHTPKVLQKQANEPSVLSGYLHKSTDKGKTWCKRWFAVFNDFVMYEFKAHQDVIALGSIPLPGYRVQLVDNMENVFKITHHKHVVFFQPENTAGKDRWTEVLSKVVNLQLPEEVEETTNRHSIQSTDSSSGGQDMSQNADKPTEVEETDIEKI